MRLQTDVNPSALPALMRQVAGVAGWQVWKNRVQALTSLAKGNPFWPRFVVERHSLEMAFCEARQHIKNAGRCAWPPRTAEEYRLYCFVANIARVHEKLGEGGKSRLSGQIRSGLEKEFGLGPLDFEMKIAAHLMSRGFDVDFHDLENGGGYDFLATSDGRKIEIECKYISGDTGRKIHRRKLYDLGGLLSPIMSRAVEGKQGGIHLRVDLPDRLHGSKEQQQAVASQIQIALNDESPSENEVCGISIERFGISSSLFSTERGTTITEDDTREFCNVRGLESGHTLFRWTPDKTAIVISFKSRKEDIVLTKILERLKEDAKRQFTRQLPALICVHMADLSEKQLLDIAEVDKSETPTGIRIVLSKLLRERPHVHSVALMTDGLVRVEQNQIGNLCTTSTQETGRTYIVRNSDHPQANDLVLNSIFSPLS
jgi:hypothetical protein